MVGRNGAGKTSLLRCLAGIVPLDSGRAECGGRVVSLLELGAGFGQDFTGRENIWLNGALHGFSREDIEERIDRIVDFSELGEFIDVPVKAYSSGMFLRLGFAIVAHLDADVLLIDEILAVGDESFQRKCLQPDLRADGAGRDARARLARPDRDRARVRPRGGAGRRAQGVRRPGRRGAAPLPPACSAPRPAPRSRCARRATGAVALARARDPGRRRAPAAHVPPGRAAARASSSCERAGRARRAGARGPRPARRAGASARTRAVGAVAGTARGELRRASGSRCSAATTTWPPACSTRTRRRGGCSTASRASRWRAWPTARASPTCAARGRVAGCSTERGGAALTTPEEAVEHARAEAERKRAAGRLSGRLRRRERARERDHRAGHARSSCASGR